jgi:hypothetical protein
VTDRDDVSTELRRVVDRLNSLPLSKVEPLRDDCHHVAALIVDQTRQHAPTVPSGETLPMVGSTAAGAQLSVVGRDYLAAAPDSADHTIVLAALTDLRRSLP